MGAIFALFFCLAKASHCHFFSLNEFHLLALPLPVSLVTVFLGKEVLCISGVPAFMSKATVIVASDQQTPLEWLWRPGVLLPGSHRTVAIGEKHLADYHLQGTAWIAN